MKRSRISFFISLVLLFTVISLQAQPEDVVVTSISSTPVSCGDGDNGTITVTVSGGVPPYNYLLLKSTTQIEFADSIASTTYMFMNNITAYKGYLVIVSDSDNDTGDGLDWVDVDGPSPISIDSSVSTDMSCHNITDGTVTVRAHGEGGNFKFTLAGPDPQFNYTGDFAGLSEGFHTVTVSDKDGCPSTAVTPALFIKNPDNVTITDIDPVDVVCYGDNTGSISILPGGGTPSGSGTGYTYSWTGPGFSSNQEDITDLEAGDYFVTVFDGNSCAANAGPIPVSQPDSLTADLVSTKDVTCNGGSDGEAEMNPGGGAGGYSYSWDGQLSGLISTDQNPTNLVADTYDFTLFDGDGCSKTFTDFAIINEPDPFTIDVILVNDVSCPGGMDGSADIEPSGGNGTYTYSWSSTPPGYSSTDPDPFDMPAGNYHLTITDEKGCDSTFSDLFTITQPDPISVTLVDSGDVTCFGGSDGSAQISITGGTPLHKFSWTGRVTGHTSILENPDDLVADTFDLSILDGNDCPALFEKLVTIEQPDDLDVAVDKIVDVECNGEFTGAIEILPGGGTPILSFLWSGPNGYSVAGQNISNLEAGDYSLRITDARSCFKDFIDVATVGTNPAITATFDLTHVSCNGDSTGAINAHPSGGMPGYTFQWSGPYGFSKTTEDIFDLIPGPYRLTITDNLGCVKVMPDQMITVPTPITAAVTVINNDCFGDSVGSVDLTPSGGIDPYIFEWTGPGGFNETTEDIAGLKAGSYSVTITDDNNCAVLFTDIATVTEPPKLQVSSVKSDISCGGQSDGSIDITVTGGIGSYGFQWTGPGGFNETTQNIGGLDSGTYNLTITYGTGCMVDFPALETIIEPTSIIATYDSQVDVVCNGEATGSIKIDVTGGTAPLTFDWTNSGGATVFDDEDPTGLPAGTYSLEITDVNGCSVSYPDMVTITEPTAITVSLAKTDILCHGDGNGTITVTASGGSGSLEYSRIADLDIFYQSSNVFNGVGAVPEPHTIWTRDTSGCVVTDTISILEPDEVLINGEEKSGQNLCYGDSSAQISIYDVTGGVEPYEYSISGSGGPFFSTSLFPNLPAGNYQTAVRDANGCIEPGSLINISHPDSMRIETYTQEDITSCYYSREGRIIIVGSGGNGNITYTLNDTLTQTTGDFQNLPGGAHTITMEDENGCMRDTMVVILAPTEIVVDNVTVKPVTGCFGDPTGEISVTGSGGTGPITYSKNSIDYQPGGTFTGLSAGDYTITLKDNLDCTRDTVITVGEPGPITIPSELITPITCNGAKDGIIEILASGGTGPLSYTLNPGAISDPAGLFSGLDTGTYTVTVDDSKNCGPVYSSPLTLTDPPEFFLDSIVDKNISCNGAGDGTIRIYASGGVQPYEYSIDTPFNWGSDSIFAGLTPAIYEVYVRDANFCQIYGGPVTMTDPPPLTLAVTTTDIVTCSGDSTGAIEAAGGGGTGILEYSLNGLDFQLSGTFTGLTAGDTTVYVRDEGGCLRDTTVSINEPAPVMATIETTDATFGNLGSITITSTTGGTSPYEYTIGGPGGPFSSDTVYTQLEAGIYHVIVKDLNGCTYEPMVNILDVFPLNVEVTVIPVSCFGADDGSIEMVPQDAEGTVEYSINGGLTFFPDGLFENLTGDSTYYLVAMDGIGKVFTDSVTINEPAEIILSTSPTSAECNAFSETGSIYITASGGAGGFTYLWSDGSTEEDRTGIVAGTYILETTDANSCTRMDTILVSSLMTVDAYAGEDTTVCHGTSIQLFGQGGHIPSWSPSIFLSDPDIASPMASQVTETTTYVLTITEDSTGYGCFNTDSVTITVYPLTGIEVTEDTFIVRGTSVQLEASGGPFSAYRWEPSSGLDNSTIPNPVASPQESIRYTVYATSEYECEESDSVYIEVIEDIMAYNVFSPNGDGINDYFDIEHAYRFPEMIVEVFGRWGDLLFSTVGYDDSSRWDGTTRGGKEAPVGTYYYVIIPYSGASPITGNVTIIR